MRGIAGIAAAAFALLASAPALACSLPERDAPDLRPQAVVDAHAAAILADETRAIVAAVVVRSHREGAALLRVEEVLRGSAPETFEARPTFCAYNFPVEGERGLLVVEPGRRLRHFVAPRTEEALRRLLAERAARP
jgi:hypothetical protein